MTDLLDTTEAVDPQRRRRAPVSDAMSRQADYLPDFYGPPIAAGPEIETVDMRRSRLDGGSFRRQVPTSRLLAEGAPPVVHEEVAEAATPDEGEPRRRRVWGATRQVLANADPRSIPGPRRPLVVFGLASLVIGWDTQALQIIAPELRAEFGVSITALATLSSVMGFVVLILRIPAAYLYDRVKRVRLIRIGILAKGLSTLLTALAPTFGAFVGAGLVGTAGDVIDGPGTGPLMADYYPSRTRGRVFAFLALTGKIGGLIGLPVAGYLITRMGWRAAVLVLSVLGMSVSLLSFLLREPVRGGMDRLEMGVSPEVAALVQQAPSLSEGLRAGWSIRTLRLSAVTGMVGMFTGPVSIYLGLIMAEKFQLDAGQRANLAFLTSLATLPALLIGGAAVDWVLSKRPRTLVYMLAGLSFLQALSTFWVAIAPTLVLVIIPGIFLAYAGAAIGPGISVISTLAVPARYRATAIQVLVPFSMAGLIVAPMLTRFAEQLPIQQGLIMFTPFYIVAGLVQLRAGTSLEADIRAARAASLAFGDAHQAAEDGRNRLLVCRDVDVVLGEVTILANIDLDVAEGECLAVLGTNGAGKSTLLRAIAGVYHADNGAIVFDGREITHAPAHENARAGIVLMPGGEAVFPSMTVRENLVTAALMRGTDRRGVDEGVDYVLGLFPALTGRLDTPAGALSGGEQQMLALGQAFLLKPRLLMIDELSLGLAPAIVEQLLEIVRQIRANGTTVMLVEQSLNVAMTIADRAIFMEKGRIEMDGPVEELLRRPDLVRSIFMGGAAGGRGPAPRRRPSSSEEAVDRALVAEGVCVSFGGVRALDGVDIRVVPGEVVGIIGANGAGKTTLFDVLSGHLRPDAGTIKLAGEVLDDRAPEARARLGLGRAFQNARLFPPLTVRENIAVALERRAVKSPVAGALWTPGVRKSERNLAYRIDGYIELLGLGAYADKFVSELSTGTRRAVEVACIMAFEPKILLLDEPSSGLAQAETEALGPALLRVVRDTACGMLVIEHDLPLITSISDRLVVMDLGRILTTGNPQEVTNDPRVLQSYLAASNDVIERSGSKVGAVLQALTAVAPDTDSTA